MKHVLELQALRGDDPCRDKAKSNSTIIISTASLAVCVSSRLSAALRSP